MQAEMQACHDAQQTALMQSFAMQNAMLAASNTEEEMQACQAAQQTALMQSLAMQNAMLAGGVFQPAGASAVLTQPGGGGDIASSAYVQSALFQQIALQQATQVQCTAQQGACIPHDAQAPSMQGNSGVGNMPGFVQLQPGSALPDELLQGTPCTSFSSGSDEAQVQALAQAQAQQAACFFMQLGGGASLPKPVSSTGLRAWGKVVRRKNGKGIIFCKDAKQKYGRDVTASVPEMQRAQADVGHNVSFVMEFSKFEGPQAFQLQVEVDDGSSVGQQASRGKPEGIFKVRPGDWNCPRCKVFNFARNVDCRSCRTQNPKATAPVQASSQSTLASQLWERSRASGSSGRSRSRGRS
eukprot:TRINITY_DN45231_c0_g1_i1.p1 TRINITY_DN45231_c0_g1~~TRINITY_DN45231_c0_g1_i1.p1  ORF type:complete len:354 (-),score=60.23 TRINITY_DN45231_c0_g1_i1:128-1189(-)